ncbi:MAG: Gfo/Idh/MocA family oxidoreductase, partial [Lentisphaeria bacterium]|nr:Gfo/Idh/MocA family oxidoreductase [Lentisphaeria bacterium]
MQDESPFPNPLSLGFIGGALDSAVGYTHFVSCRMDRRWSLDAGCFSALPQENRRAGEAYGVAPERVYPTWEDLLRQEKGRLDAVVILTPTPSHGDIVLGCLREGFPVICEKALGVDSGEAAEILRVRDETRGFLALSYNYSGYPMVRELRRRIQDGALGTILHFQAEMQQEGFRRTDARGNRPVPQEWRLHDGRIPTIYLDLGVHLHQLVHYLTGGSPLEVVAAQGSFGWFDVIDNVTCLCRYSGGVQGQMWFSKSALGHRNGLRIRVYGSKAAAEWYQANPEELLISHADGRREMVDRASGVDVASLARYNRFKAGHPAGFIEAFANLYTDLADCLRQYRATGRWNSGEVFGAELAGEGLRMLQA